MIIWSDYEWDKLADLVWVMRKNDPVSTLTTLVGCALEQFPVDRRRKITGTADLKKLAERLVRKHEALAELAAMVDPLRDRVATLERACKSEAEILASLTDDEVLTLFGPRVLGLMVQRITEKQAVRPSMMAVATVLNEPKVKKAVRPKVVILGPLPRQAREIEKALSSVCDVVCLTEDTRNVPQKADLWINWVDFSSHSLESKVKSVCGNCLKTYRGGVGGLITFVRGKL